MIAGQLVFDGFNYDVLDDEAQGIGPKAGQTVKLRVLIFVDHQNGASVAFRFTPEQFAEFIERIGGAAIVVPNAAARTALGLH